MILQIIRGLGLERESLSYKSKGGQKFDRL
jgi:hypothetical protein